MKPFLSLFVFISLLSGASFAEEPANPKCHCTNCKCTPDHHCGCYSEEGCHCAPGTSHCGVTTEQ